MIRTVLMGTPAFALPTFDKLLKDTQLAAVVTQPDRNKDRKGNVIFSPVKSAALEHNIPVYQFEKIRVQGVETLKSLRPDVIITCAYGQILSQEIIDIPRYGILNVHASLLPRYRGSSPLQWALINGDKVTGVTIMKTDVGMDTGAMLAKEKFNIPDDMYIDGLFEKAASVGAELLIKTLPDYIAGKITPVAQNESEATKCRMLKKEDALINWTMDAEKVRNKIRGMGYGYTFYNGSMLKIFKLENIDAVGSAGHVEIENKKIIVYCGKGAVEIKLLQLANKNKLLAEQFLNGIKMRSGEVLTSD